MKVIELVRVSTQEQGDDSRAGLPRQKEANALTVQKHGLTLVKTVQIVDVSGTSVLHTSEVKELVNLMHSGHIGGVVIADWDRLIRLDNFNDFALLQHFKDTGTLIYLPDQVIDLNTQSGFLIGGFQSIISGNELTQIKKRMVAAKEVKRRNGENPGSDITLPLGVSYDRQNKRFYYNQKIHKVRELFRAFHEEGIRNYCELQRLTGIHHRTIFNLLRNQIYIGYRVYSEKRGPEKMLKANGRQGDRKKVKRRPDEVIRVKVIDEPLIDEAVFLEIQEKIRNKNRSYHAIRSKRGERFLYAGFLRCGQCGEKLYTTSGGRNHKKDYYLCRSKNYVWAGKNGPAQCPTPYLQRELVDSSVTSFVGEALLTKDYLASLIESALSDQGLDQLRSEQFEIRGALKDSDKKRERFLDLYGDGKFSREELDEKIEQLNQEASRLRAKLSRLQESMGLLERSRLYGRIEQVISTLVEYPFWTPHQKRSFLRKQIPEIAIKKEGINAFTLRVSTDMNPLGKDSWPPRA